jgi:hypothetical protein
VYVHSPYNQYFCLLNSCALSRKASEERYNKDRGKEYEDGEEVVKMEGDWMKMKRKDEVGRKEVED